MTIASAVAMLFLYGGCTNGRSEVVPVANTSADSLRVEQDSTATYSYTIEYPPAAWMQSVAGEAIQAWTAERKREFIASTPDSTSINGLPIRPWELFVRFRTPMKTDVFTSVLAEVYEYTGGAHGMTSYEAFNYDVVTGRRLMLSDLFPDSTALQPASAYVREELSARLLRVTASDEMLSEAEREAWVRQEQWIAEGTAPVSAHYETFFLVPAESGHAAGITFVLPPYQVAPYAAGTQEVFVPASVFADELNPAYRDRFRMSSQSKIR